MHHALSAYIHTHHIHVRGMRPQSRYGNFVDALAPQGTCGLALGCRGPRAELTKTVLNSTEFQQSPCAADPDCVLQRLEVALCLNRSDCVSQSRQERSGNAVNRERFLFSNKTSELVDSICNHADAVGVFGNVALLAPEWGV